MHVVDVASSNYKDQLDVVNQTLAELKVLNKPTLLVFNKIDIYKERVDLDIGEEYIEDSLEHLKQSWAKKLSYPCIFISAEDKTNLEAFRKKMYQMVKKIHVKRYPFNDYLY